MYGFVLWLPSIIRSGGENLGMVEVGWLSSVPYLAATIAMIVVSWASDKLQNRKLFVWPLLLIAAFAFIGSGGGPESLLGLLYPAGGCRCRHVRPVRSVFAIIRKCCRVTSRAVQWH